MDAFAHMNELAGGPASMLLLAGAAVTAGGAMSLHCFAMCGPLACYGCSRATGRSRRGAMAGYHLARVAAYAVFGAAAGLAGHGVLNITHAPPRWIPWAMAAVLLATAFGLGETVAALPCMAKILHNASLGAAKLAPAARSVVFGALTPLLPCGLLYGLFATAFASGSVGAGAVLAGAFAVGGIPALLLGQLQASWMRRLPRGSDVVLRRVVPIVVAALLIYRALTPEQCPLCQ